jgi:hypothetical protein
VTRPARPIRLGRRALPALVLAAAALAAGCGSQPARVITTADAALRPPSLALSTASPTTSWAVLDMGGSAATYNNFWEMFARPAGSSAWKLVTPPGMASNGGLVLAGPAGRSLDTAFRPTQLITFSPLISTDDAGARWSTGQVAPGLADVPDSLAADPAADRLIGLTASEVELSGTAGSGWTKLATLSSLAATAAGRKCRLSSLTAVAFSPAGIPLAAGSCAKAGVAGIFAFVAGAWQPAGPPLPAELADHPVTVLRLRTAGGRETALLAAGSQASALIAVAWTGDGSGHWAISPAFGTHHPQLLSASFGPGGSVALVLSPNLGETLSGPGSSWHQLAKLPSGTQVLVPEGPGRFQALAAHRSVLTVWTLDGSSATWAKTQVETVPIVYGSSD